MKDKIDEFSGLIKYDIDMPISKGDWLLVERGIVTDIIPAAEFVSRETALVRLEQQFALITKTENA